MSIESSSAKESFKKKPNETKNSTQEISETLLESCRAQKEVLVQSLESGINIKSQQEYESLSQLLVLHKIVSKVVPFEKLVTSSGYHISTPGIMGKRPEVNKDVVLFSLRTDERGQLQAFSGVTLLPIRLNITPLKGTLQDNGTFLYTPDTSLITFKNSLDVRNANGKIPTDKIDCPDEEEILLPQTKKEEKVGSIEKKDKKFSKLKAISPYSQFQAYQVSGGDTIWKIIQKHYDFSLSPNPSRDIANIIEKLENGRKNNSIFKKQHGKIFVGNTFYLPKQIMIRYQNGENQILKVKEK